MGGRASARAATYADLCRAGRRAGCSAAGEVCRERHARTYRPRKSRRPNGEFAAQFRFALARGRERVLNAS